MTIGRSVEIFWWPTNLTEAPIVTDTYVPFQCTLIHRKAFDDCRWLQESVVGFEIVSNLKGK